MKLIYMHRSSSSVWHKAFFYAKQNQLSPLQFLVSCTLQCICQWHKTATHFQTCVAIDQNWVAFYSVIPNLCRILVFNKRGRGLALLLIWSEKPNLKEKSTAYKLFKFLTEIWLQYNFSLNFTDNWAFWNKIWFWFLRKFLKYNNVTIPHFTFKRVIKIAKCLFCYSYLWCTPIKQGTSDIFGKWFFCIIVRNTFSALSCYQNEVHTPTF